MLRVFADLSVDQGHGRVAVRDDRTVVSDSIWQFREIHMPREELEVFPGIGEPEETQSVAKNAKLHADEACRMCNETGIWDCCYS
jgi:hypothetical protein